MFHQRMSATLLLCLALQGCAVVAVVDAGVTVVATAVKVGAKAVGTAVNIVTPSSDKKK